MHCTTYQCLVVARFWASVKRKRYQERGRNAESGCFVDVESTDAQVHVYWHPANISVGSALTAYRLR
eukprot:2839333-Prymnesium_polylepis.1